MAARSPWVQIPPPPPSVAIALAKATFFLKDRIDSESKTVDLGRPTADAVRFVNREGEICMHYVYILISFNDTSYNVIPRHLWRHTVVILA